MRRLLAVVAATGLLAACGFTPDGVGEVTPSAVNGYYTETASDSGGMTAGEYLVASVSYTNQKCHEFFTKLALLKENSRFLDDVLTAGIAAGAPLMTTFGVGASTVGAWTSGVNFANGVNKTAADIYLFADFKNELQPLVFREMDDFLDKKGLSKLAQDYIRDRAKSPFLVSQKTVDLMLARNLATDYAAKCSLPNMRTLIAASLNKNKGEQESAGLLAPTSGTTSQ